MADESREHEDQSLPSGKRISPWRWAGCALGGLSALAGTGAAYQSIAEARERRRRPPPGMLIDVGGHRLHLHCVGEGTPTVVLEAGLSHGMLEWGHVQAGVGEFTRACAYDRAGHGRSDPGPSPRTSW